LILVHHSLQVLILKGKKEKEKGKTKKKKEIYRDKADGNGRNGRAVFMKF